MAAADPDEGLVRVVGVGILPVIDEPFRGPLVAGPALDRLVAVQGVPVAAAAEPQLPGLDVLDVIPFWDDRRAGLEHQGAESPLAELLGRPAAADAGADHDGVVLGGG